jgi:hypothetical protein
MLLGFSWLHAQCVPQAPDIFVSGIPGDPSSGYYLWGQQVDIYVASEEGEYSGDFYRIEYFLSPDGSLGEEVEWTPVVSGVTEFPVTITLPPLAPPTYFGFLYIRAVAVCADEGVENAGINPYLIPVIDRLGNRPERPIYITMVPSGPGIWRADPPIINNTGGLATSDEYNPSTGARWGSESSRDLFFRLILPECLDSLVLNTCSENTNFNTRIHFINATKNDTITNDDQGIGCSVEPGGHFFSQLVVLGLPNALKVTQTELSDIGYTPDAKVVRDTALLVPGHILYIVVEGTGPMDEGDFELTITGYKLRPSSINVAGVPDGPVCVNSSITLDATTPGATAYRWLVNGNEVEEATSATYTITPDAEGTIEVTARVIFNPNEDEDCASDFLEASVTITVEDFAQAQIAYADNVVSGQTLPVTEGSDVTFNVSSDQTGNSYTWKLYASIPPSDDDDPILTGTESSFTISNIEPGEYTVILEAVRGTGACGTTQDIVYITTCPPSLRAPEIVLTGEYPPLADPDNNKYLWGQQVQITLDDDSPEPIGDLKIVYSLDDGDNWIEGPDVDVSEFPITITLPPLAPPTYEDTLKIAVRATGSELCNLTPAMSNEISIALTDRPGNRADNAITIELTPSDSDPGMWTATISDSTDGLGLSNEYNAATGARWGTGSRDLFFVLTLPECLDSLVLNTCSENTRFDTRIHLINAATNDTITNDDQGTTCGSPAGGGSVNPNWLSQLVVFGLPNALEVTQTQLIDIGFAGDAKVVRDTALLVAGHTLYIVVEGSGLDEGKFELTITGYKLRPSSINVTEAPSGPVCINSAPITLDATTPGATAYQWLDANGDPIEEATSATYTITPDAEGTITVTAVAIFNPNDDESCLTSSDSVASQPITITVEDTARAQIADANNNVVSGQTLTFTAGSNVTLKVKSSQTSGNTYTWKRYNSIPPSGTPTTSTDNPLTINNISAGSYTVILEAVRGTGACGTTRDTVYLNVTTGLRTDAGTFSIFPNPNTGAFTIAAPAMDTYRVQVLDVAGRLVVEDTFTGSTHQMRVSLPAGVYQVRLVAGEKVQVGRLIITE